MLKQKYFLTDIFILSAEKQPIKLSWRKIEWLHISTIKEFMQKKDIVDTIIDNLHLIHDNPDIRPFRFVI